MSQADLLIPYRPHVDALSRAIDAGDDAAFRRAFEALREGMNAEFLPELKRITETAQGALRRFREETRLDALAADEVPDARKRLQHVVKLTEEAANRTLDLVERSGPIVDQAAREAAVLLEAWNAGDSSWPHRAHTFIERAVKDTNQVRGHLSEMLMAQGFQDITGQIIRGVVSLVGELESVLGQLVVIASGDGTTRAVRALSDAPREDLMRGVGPTVPGVRDANAVSDQDDIDALLSKFASGG